MLFLQTCTSQSVVRCNSSSERRRGPSPCEKETLVIVPRSRRSTLWTFELKSGLNFADGGMHFDRLLYFLAATV
jgi:hypothetical protein